MSTVNDPAVISEITALHDAYEHALAANDVATLTRFFWDSFSRLGRRRVRIL